ncbi:DnaT-like ssDNA-binding domain-containing protein [Thalassolituus sp.]|uniref:DnaT-like ssDNA-binding domain-containing protein n=1 Tax=Thalassolituus sp. TaxID=2030822 RepID=UPI00260B131D|nr:DnaT-like ssDNA-binding domain-containing protein [Thalassolituus sp.]
MARIRTIKPEIWQDEHLAEVSAETMLLAIGLLNHSDDEGFFKAHPKLVEAAVFPIRETSLNIHGMLSELSNIGYIELFDGSDGKAYGLIINFEKHQKVNRPSPSKIKPLRTFTEHSVSPQEQLTAGKEQGTGNREQGTQQLQQHANRFSENVQPYQQQPEMSEDWNPDETTVRRIAMTSIPENFIISCVPEFRAYWLTAGRLPHGGNFQTAFLKSVQKAWAKHLNDTNQRGNGHAGSQLSSREAELRKANESTDWAQKFRTGFPGADTDGHSDDQLALGSGHSDFPEVAGIVPGPGRH